MVSYYKISALGKWKDSICDSYVVGGLIKNPIIAGMIVTIITMMIAYYYGASNSQTTRIFVFASLTNTAFLLFHASTVKKQITEKIEGNGIANELAGLRDIPSTDPLLEAV